jgi:hypothetical protein
MGSSDLIGWLALEGAMHACRSDDGEDDVCDIFAVWYCFLFVFGCRDLGTRDCDVLQSWRAKSAGVRIASRVMLLLPVAIA